MNGYLKWNWNLGMDDDEELIDLKGYLKWNWNLGMDDDEDYEL